MPFPIALLLAALVPQTSESEKLENSWAVQASFGVYCLAFSPDGKTLAAGGHDQSIALFDCSNGALGKTLANSKDASKEPVTGVGFTADSVHLLSAGHDGIVRQWDLRTGKEVKRHSLGPVDGSLEVSGRAYDFVVSPDYKSCAATLFEKIVILKSAGLEESGRLPGHPPAVINEFQSTGGLHGLSFSRDGSRLASAGNDGTLKVWDLKGGRELRAIKARGNSPNAVALSGDGKLVACAGEGNTVKVWDVQTGKVLMTGSHADDSVSGVAFSPSGQSLVSADSKSLKVWSVASGKELASAPTQNGVDAMTLSRDGTLIALSNIPSASVSVYHWTGPKTATEDKK